MFETVFARDLFHSTLTAAKVDENIPYLVIFFVTDRNLLLLRKRRRPGCLSMSRSYFTTSTVTSATSGRSAAQW